MDKAFRVLVADDEKLIAQNIARRITAINSSFLVIAIASDGLEALELVDKLLPDVVFTDIKMPELDGISLIRQLNTAHPNIKTVMVSGYNDFELVRSALRNQATDYLLKPISNDELKKTLQKLEDELLAEINELGRRHEETPAELVERIMTYIRHNYASPIDLSHLANEYHFSSAYLSKIFKDHANISPGRYLRDCRMNMAKKLLRDTTLPVKDVADKVGYPDHVHFSKSFKNTTGFTPAQYREQASHLR